MFRQAIDFASKKVDITDTGVSTIMQAGKMVLFHEGDPWVIQPDNKDFGRLMGLYDIAKVCELVGAFLLNRFSQVIDNKKNQNKQTNSSSIFLAQLPLNLLM